MSGTTSSSSSTTASSSTTTTSTTTATFTPLYRITKTILGVTNDLESTLPTTPLYDINSTLNAKYQVLPKQVPGSGQHPTIKYFGIGINGARNVDGTNLSEPQEVSSLNMDIYQPIPFRCVTLDNDLSATERQQYRMRVVITQSSQQYVCYYLKVITIDDQQVQYTRLDPTTGNEVSYALDYENLTPTPPATSVDGSSNSISSEVDVLVSTNFPLAGTEVLEAVQVLYSGDLRRARITEIGIYTGTDYTTTANDVNNNPFSYTESIMTQLSMHYTFNGVDMASPTASFNQSFSFGSGDLVLI